MTVADRIDFVHVVAHGVPSLFFKIFYEQRTLSLRLYLGRPAKRQTPALGRGSNSTDRRSVQMRGEGPNYNCPYLCSTARQRLLTRQLFAASVAPQRSKLSQLIPPERSQSIAAAGRHGASSARSMAFAEVA
jgi:hypothetical protein